MMSFVWNRISKISSSFLSGVVLGLPIYVTVNDYLFSIARVEGTSMQPTLNSSGSKTSDLVFLDRWHMNPSEIAHGDIVALTAPNDHQVNFIKRIIGLEGDVLNTPRYKHNYVVIPSGHCWVEGDNSKSSLDSNKFGPVSLGLIKGKATHIVWPPKRWCKLKQTVPEDRLAHGRKRNADKTSDSQKLERMEIKVEVRDLDSISDTGTETLDISYTTDFEVSTVKADNP